MGAWLNESSTSARIARESTIRGGYASGYYKPMIVPMGSTAKSVQAADIPMVHVPSGDAEPSIDALSLSVRNRQYEQLKNEYMRSLFIMAGLGATVVYLLVAREK